MFIYIVTYKKPMEEVERLLQAHRDFLDEQNRLGKLVASGPQTPRVGGVIMMYADSKEEAEAIIANDPFNINGIADYQIIEFTPTKGILSRL